jgi:hypothetical protein
VGTDLDIPAREARELLREAGHEVGRRGPLSKQELAALGEIRSTSPPPDEGGAMAAAEPPGSEPGPDMTERTPGTAGGQPGATKSKAPLARRLLDQAKKPKRPRRDRPAHRWVSTSGAVESVLSQLAWSARKIPPLQKVLYAEAVMAGPVVEDTARGTRLDKVMLQPLARNWERFEVADALIGVPVVTAMIALFGGAVMAPDGSGPLIDGQTGLPVFDQRTEAMVMGLRFSLRSWLKISRRNADDIIESAQQQSELDAEVDRMVAWILAPPGPGQSGRDVKAEAAQFAAGQTEPEPGSQDDMTGRMEQAARSSAFAPTPATGSKSP